MKKLILSMGMSLDGLVARPGRYGAGGWGLPPAAFAQSLSRLGSSTSTASSCNRWHWGMGFPCSRTITAPLRLELVDAQTYSTGSALHVYRPAPAAS